MDIKEIQDKMNNFFEGKERKIVFWYDDDAAYAEEINQLELAGESKVIKLTGSNNFAIKLLLEHQDLNTNYLVYAPFTRPEDKENFLVDIFYYSEQFYSDKLIQLMGDMNIPPECQDEVKLYKKFWTANNVEKFKNLAIEINHRKEIVIVKKRVLIINGGLWNLLIPIQIKKKSLA